MYCIWRPVPEELPQIWAYTLYFYKLESYTCILPLIAWIYLRWNFISARVSAVQGHPRSLIFGASRKRVCDFLLVRHSNLGPILHRFRDIGGFLCSRPHPYSTLILGCSRCTRSPMLWSMWEGALSYSAVKLISKCSNLCHYGTWTLRTDGRTDRQMTHCGITALCTALRGKNTKACRRLVRSLLILTEKWGHYMH